MSSVSIIIVTYNSSRWIPQLFLSIKQQTQPAQQVLIVDNASTDSTLQDIAQWTAHTELIQNTENVWFSRAVNQALDKVKTEFVLLLNPDALLVPEAISVLTQAMNTKLNIGAVTGKVMRHGNILDGFGIAASRARQFYNRGEGEQDHAQFDQQKTFGVSGGFALFRMSALRSVAFKGEILDEDIVAYKDDVDLSYRLRLAGWEIMTTPQVIGSHQRTVDSPADRSDQSKAKNRGRFSLEIRRFSTRNQLWCLIKNEPFINLLLDFPWIAWYEFKKFAYILLLDPKVLTAYGQFWLKLPRMLKKRRWIQSKRKISPKTLRQLCRM